MVNIKGIPNHVDAEFELNVFLPSVLAVSMLVVGTKSISPRQEQ